MLHTMEYKCAGGRQIGPYRAYFATLTRGGYDAQGAAENRPDFDDRTLTLFQSFGRVAHHMAQNYSKISRHVGLPFKC
ncbi:hypothetical protein E7681_12590 [Thalassobius vesicularis]|uniref:Uncharacterized protein n=1 Tax=Thalassobius vesicularis TaxID=1294297 RepID=A0A4S3M845_9RHOB|nr:hypothetical protein [Thalassobius vesicularis]THD73522.1 hypothetical protein E7681_12590 [Thalassobius vesicularis]